ncbi:unnamed protein product, partial [Bemisia tabaci]
QRVWNTQDPQSQQAPAYQPAPPLGYPTGSSAYSQSSPTPKGYSTRDGTTGDGTRALSYGTNSGRRLPRIRLESPDTSPVRSPKNRENGNGGSAIPADYPYAEITASAAAFGAKGKRDHMEDRFVIDETLKKQFGATSEWARVNIIQALKDQIQLEKQRILWKLQEEMAKFKYSWATSEWARVNIIQALKDQIQLEKQRILWKLQEGIDYKSIFVNIIEEMDYKYCAEQRQQARQGYMPGGMRIQGQKQPQGIEDSGNSKLF